MIASSALCAAVAVALLLSGDGTRRAARRLESVPDAIATRSEAGAARITLMVAAGSLVLLAAVGFGLGASAAAVATALVATAVTVAMLARRHLREHRRVRQQAAVAQACAAVAAQVRVGRIPAEALTSAADDHVVLAEPARALALGGDVVRSLQSAARAPGQGGLGELARAWQFAQHTGAPMAAVLDQVATALREDQATGRTVAAELAGPRASGVVMAVLPFVGVGLGYLIGGDPVSFLVGGPIGWACLLAGTGLALVGVLWLDRLARVTEPGQDETPSRETR